MQQASPNHCTANTLGAGERLSRGVPARAGHQSSTGWAPEAGVSRKFVYQQANVAPAALDEAFAPAVADDQVLLLLPITKNWLQPAARGLTLSCHRSSRGVHECCRARRGVHRAVGTVPHLVPQAIAKARPHHLGPQLAPRGIAGLDEIFQKRPPVRVGADLRSTSCFVLSAAAQRDGDTWALRWRACQERGFAPKATRADFGTGLRAGQQRALPNVPCRGAVCPALQELTPVVSSLEKRAYATITAPDQLEHQRTKRQRQARRDQLGQVHSLSRKVAAAAREQAQASTLAAAVAVRSRWLRAAVGAVAALPEADRGGRFDFVVAEWPARVPHGPHRLGPVGTLLTQHRDQRLACAGQLDQDRADRAAAFAVPVASVRALLDLQTLDKRQPLYGHQQATLQERLRGRFHDLEQAVRGLRKQVVRASSLIANSNSRLRSYCFRRRASGAG